MKNECKDVLVIDDDQGIRDILKDVLEIHGYKVTVAKDGQEGIKKLSTMAAPCLILLDLMMPKVNGWGFLDYQKANPSFAQIPVIICSAYEGSARSIGTNPVLIKPLKLESLLGAVKAFCA